MSQNNTSFILRLHLLLLLVIGCGRVAYPEEVPAAAETPPVERGLLQDGRIAPVVISADLGGKVTGIVRAGFEPSGKPPLDSLIDPVYGYAYFEPARTIVFYRSSEDVSFADRVLIDADGDGDLDDETPVTLPRASGPVKVEVVLEGRTQPFALRRVGNDVMLYPLQWKTGTVDFRGEAISAGVLDVDHDGVYGHGSLILLDLNGNGTFDVGGTSLLGEVLSSSKDPVFLGNEFYTLDLAEDGSSLAVAPYAGPMGRLAVQIPTSPALADSVLGLGLAPEQDWSRMIPVVVGFDELPLSIPAGEYSVGFSAIQSSQGMPLAVFDLPPLTIREDETTTIVLDAPQMQISAVLRGDRLYVGAEWKSANVQYSILLPEGATMVRGPQVDVSPVGDEDALHTGNMEYG